VSRPSRIYISCWFEGGFTFEAAEAILGGTDSLGILRRWNLLHLESERYTPDSLVEAVLSPDLSAHTFHYEFYKHLVEKHKNTQDYAGLQPESENLETAFDWAMAIGKPREALDLLKLTYNLWYHLRRFDYRLECAKRVSAALEDQPDKILWAAAKNTLGYLYMELPTGDREHNLYEAIKYYKAALVYRTPRVDPKEYATTQNNLGIAHRKLAGIRDKLANLHEAIKYYETALVYRTPQAIPLDHAITKHNLGNAYRELSKLENQVANLHKAIQCYEAALTYRRPETTPISYGMTHNMLGNTYNELASIEDQLGNLYRAIKYYEIALVYCTPQKAPLYYAQAQNGLGNVYRNLAQLENTSANLNRSIECFKLALLYRTPHIVPLEYAATQKNMGFTYHKLGEIEKSCAAWHEAKKYYLLMRSMDKADEVVKELVKLGCESS
jgi:tetratricopeptide (TPR) repeat protein